MAPGAVCIGGPNGPSIEITDGDLTLATPSKPSVDPEAAATLLMAAVEQLDEVIAGTAKVRDAAQALLDKGPYRPTS